MDYAFKNFGNEVEIRNRAIAGKIILRQIVFFNRGRTVAFLKISGKVPSDRVRLIMVVIG